LLYIETPPEVSFVKDSNFVRVEKSMRNRFIGYLALCTILISIPARIWGQPKSATSLGAPMATVKLTKTEIITSKTFRDDVAKLEATRGSPLSTEERSAYLDEMVNDVLFYQMCERDGVKVTEGELDSYIAKLRAQRPAGETDQQFSAFLATQGIPYLELRDYYKKQILIQRWLMTTKSAEIAAIPPVRTEEIVSAYELYKSKLVRPDSVKIAFLLYPFKEKSAAERIKGAEVMKDLSDRLSKGESFDVIRLKSQDGGYAANKESIYFERNEVFIKQFGKVFYDTVFSLKDGTNSIAFETDAGWWIVRRLEFLPQKQLELSDPYRLGQNGSVQDYIAQLIAKQREAEFLQKTFTDLFKKLRSQADIKIIGAP
jgi:parvulin-like peptidyl-prolyl isomerase